MILQPAGPADARGLAHAHARSFDAPWSAEDFADLLGSPGVFAVAARDGSEIGGFILARAIAGEAEVLTLAVDPQRRRTGVARALLQSATAMSQTLGAETLFLEVAADNAPAIALYTGAGFERAGVRRGYYARATATAVDALVMRKPLG